MVCGSDNEVAPDEMEDDYYDIDNRKVKDHRTVSLTLSGEGGVFLTVTISLSYLLFVYGTSPLITPTMVSYIWI